MDYRNVRELDGGFNAWQEAGYAVTSAPEQTMTLPPSENVHQPRLSFKAGKSAVDFQLKTPGGVEYQLSKLLAEKPVMLQFGSYT